jgi:O-antigen/teichoic acid export membrane protein
MTLRGLLRGSLLYTLGNLLPRVGAFVLLPVYTAAMLPSEFGVFSLMLSLSGVLAIAYRLGLDGSLLRLHFDVSARNRPALYVSLSAVSLAAVVVLSALLGLLAAPIFSKIFPGVAFVPFGLLALAITATTTFQYVPSALYRATEQPGRFVAFSAGVLALSVSASVFFLVVLRLGAVGGLLGQLVSGLGVVAVTAGILLGLRRRRFDRLLARAGLAFGLPLVPHALAGWILNLSDRWLIGLFIGLPAVEAQAAVGIYSFGYVLAQVVSLVAISFNAAWIPFFYSQGDRERGPAILRQMTTMATGGLAILAVGIALLAPELTKVLATARWGPRALAAADVIQVVAVASLVYGFYFMVVSTVFLRRRTRVLPLLTLLAGAGNVIANLILIPRLGIMGAAWSTLVGYSLLAGVTWLYARRGYPLDLDLPRLAVLAGGVAVAIMGGRLAVPADLSVVAGGLAHLGVALGFAVGVVLLLLAPARRLRRLLASDATSGPLGPNVGADTMQTPEDQA